MNVVIIGSDGRKFNEEQENKTKLLIEKILFWAKRGYIIHPPFYFVNNRWEFTRQQMHFTHVMKITVVSGHCPVGKEMWYCVDCGKWMEEYDFIMPGETHRGVKVFDKGGVDTWAEIIATKLGIPTDIHPATRHDWKDGRACDKCHSVLELIVNGDDHFKCPRCNKLDPIIQNEGKGYRSRNIDMAKIGTIGYTIEVAGSCRHCGGTGSVPDMGSSYKGYTEKFRTSRHGVSIKDCNKCKGTGAYSGGTFTINEMNKLGKETHKIIIK